MKKYIIVAASILSVIGSINSNAEIMSHWANLRDITGEIIGSVNEGEYVQVKGYDPSSGRIWITTSSGQTGSVAAVYLYGGTDFQYENPIYYPMDYSGLDIYNFDNYSYIYNTDYAASPYIDIIPEYTFSYEDVYLSAIQPLPQHISSETYSNIWIDVDISEQIISIYDNNEILFSTYCVTGTYQMYDTPIGDYYILNKEENAVLRGDNYEVLVAYWMPFTVSGCGIHDAPWRYDFSRDAYIRGGSHGCVNVKDAAAKQIYDLVDVGTFVRVHE